MTMRPENEAYFLKPFFLPLRASFFAISAYLSFLSVVDKRQRGLSQGPVRSFRLWKRG
jgi:hypothetical protein